MSNTPQPNNQKNQESGDRDQGIATPSLTPAPFVPSGKVTGFSGAGVSASFERRADEVKAQLDELTLQHALRGIETVNTATQGPVQWPGNRG